MNHTNLRVHSYRSFADADLRQEDRPMVASYLYLPHPSVLASPQSNIAWMTKFPKPTQQSPNRSLEKMIVFVNGMPVLVTFFQDRHA